MGGAADHDDHEALDDLDDLGVEALDPEDLDPEDLDPSADPPLASVPAFEPSDPVTEPAPIDDRADDRDRGTFEPNEPAPFDAGGDTSTRVAHATRRHGLAGGMLAAGMLGIDQVVNGRKPREDAPIVISSNSDPLDIDTDGISLSTGDAHLAAPALPRSTPIVPGRRRRRR